MQLKQPAERARDSLDNETHNVTYFRENNVIF